MDDAHLTTRDTIETSLVAILVTLISMSVPSVNGRHLRFKLLANEQDEEKEFEVIGLVSCGCRVIYE